MLGTTEWLHNLRPLERYSAPQSELVRNMIRYNIMVAKFLIHSLCMIDLWYVRIHYTNRKRGTTFSNVLAPKICIVFKERKGVYQFL
jgi:hypothetical protein